MTHRWLILLGFVVSLGFVLLLFLRIDWQVFGQTLFSLRFIWVAATCVAIIFGVLLRAVRWNLLAAQTLTHYGHFWRAVNIRYWGNLIYPLRTGEAIRLLLLGGLFLISLFFHLFLVILGFSEFSFRLPPVLFGAGVVIPLFLLGNRFGNRRVAWLAGLLYAVSEINGLNRLAQGISIKDTYFLEAQINVDRQPALYICQCRLPADPSQAPVIMEAEQTEDLYNAAFGRWQDVEPWFLPIAQARL